MMSRHGTSLVLIAASILVVTGSSILFLGTDGSDATSGDYGDFHWVMDDAGNLTVTGHGNLDYLQLGWDDCENLTLTVKDGTANIGYEVFFHCSSLTAVTINGSVGSIGNNAFGECYNMTTLTINGSVGSIGNNAFDGCDSLTTVTIDGSVGSIGNNAFDGCESLTTVTIDGSVGSIGEYAFFHCVFLSVLTVTGPITTIGSTSFEECFRLKTLNIYCNDPLNITEHKDDNGYVAYYANSVNHIHRYSADYDWSADGKSCVVHIICGNTAEHNHDISNAEIISKVKSQPTETEMGITEYTVSGTYDGFAYSDSKDVAVHYARELSVYGQGVLVLPIVPDRLYGSEMATGHIVCRRQFPLSALVHHEREVLRVVVHFVVVHVERHSAKYFVHGLVTQSQRACRLEERVVRVEFARSTRRQVT